MTTAIPARLLTYRPFKEGFGTYIDPPTNVPVTAKTVSDSLSLLSDLLIDRHHTDDQVVQAAATFAADMISVNMREERPTIREDALMERITALLDDKMTRMTTLVDNKVSTLRVEMRQINDNLIKRIDTVSKKVDTLSSKLDTVADQVQDIQVLQRQQVAQRANKRRRASEKDLVAVPSQLDPKAKYPVLTRRGARTLSSQQNILDLSVEEVDIWMKWYDRQGLETMSVDEKKEWLWLFLIGHEDVL
ncbi:hypothetical protein TREMEDRAFT_66281 [Tremella mesenterica DSM 1558]|uniref:uncharacterized protein n=1 Tax=Tremella mesenterica (strain ATCC 24925 / CBS 8224 / DSM 1558 / NBRC 9311 / NRRL Y-6157 / RJB 2259-6 / UBC 559-6) TaxID=578456 RepID=UPI00032D214C|nr:uncharacterized protein TREMEDRAFT_66281 [Tremella mesenterica DSM 1558]EIW65688.1 hypothetical protein TREMEDRAFT_66281 [Tremella mesenterica DSM 1558]